MISQGTRHPSTVTMRTAATLLAVVALLLVALQPGAGVPRVLGAPSSPLAITNVDSPDPVVSGQELTYTITITNTGGSKVTDLALTDQYNGLGGIGNPPQLQVTSNPTGPCSQNTTLVTCTLGTLPGGATWVVTIRGVVTAASGTTLNNTATVTGTRSAQTFTSSASATTLVQGSQPGGDEPDLSISKNGPSSVQVGAGIRYVLTVNNLGDANATDVRVVDNVPAGVSTITASGTSQFVCSVAGQEVTCDGGRVNAGANATITIDGTAPGAPTTLENTSVVDPLDTIAEANEFNNTSNRVTTTVVDAPPPPAPPITITKAGPAQITPGSEITYEIVVKNGTVGRADGITMTDATQGLEAGSIRVESAVSTSGTKPVCSVNAPAVSCSMTRLATNGTMTVVIKGQVIASAGSTILNTASVNANIKNKGYSATDSIQTVVKPGIDLTVTKGASPDPVCASSWPGGAPGVCTGGLTYTIIVGNSGISPAQNVVVRDPLPVGVTYHSATGTGDFTCQVSVGQVVTCTGTVPAEDTETITIVGVAPATPRTIVNTVTVDPNNAIFESDETNNVASFTTNVVTGIDLTVRKTDASPGFDPIATSGTQTYTITVDNIGTQDASGIRVRDTLPAGTIFRSVTADNGFTCAHDGAPTGGIVDCVGGAIKGTASESYFPGGANDDATITIRVFAQPIVGTMHNEVRVDPLNEIAEADETNNIDTEQTVVHNGDGATGAFNELSITLADAPDPVATSSIVTFTLVVANDGSDPAVNVTARTTLHSSFAYIDAVDSAPPGAQAFLCTSGAGNTVDCTGATIAAGGSRTITIRAFSAPQPGTYATQATVDPGNLIPEGNETNNQAQVTTLVQVGPSPNFIDLTIAKTVVGLPNAEPGGTIVYTLLVTNLGTDPAINATVRDLLPPGVTFVSARDNTAGPPPTPLGPGSFTCTHSAGVITCTGGTIDGTLDLISGIDTTRTINVTVRAPLAHDVTITNTAQVDPFNAIPEGNETNNSSDVDVLVQSAINLTVTKTGPSTATQSQNATYEITVSNEGSTAATGVVLVDPLPVGLIPLTAFTEDPNTNNFACQVEQNPVNKVTCVGDLAGGQSVKISIEVFITATDGTRLENEACVDPANLIVESREDDNCSTQVTDIGRPDLAISKTASTGVVTNGEGFSYTLVVSNQGNAATPGAVSVTDSLPAGVTYVNATGTNEFVCTFAAPTVTCTDAAGSSAGLNPGESAVITIQVTTATSSGPIVNTASVTQVAGEIVLGNNSSSVSVAVGTTAVDLVLTNIGDQPDPVVKGDTVTYRYAATNAGTTTVSSIKITQTFDSLTGIEFVSATASQGFACSPPAGLVIVCLGDLDPGATTTVTVVLQTTASAPGSLTSEIVVDPDDTIAESNEANNSATEVTTITDAICTNCIDVAVSGVLKSADPIDVGDSVTFTVTLGNIGDTSTNTTGAQDVYVQFDVFGDFTGHTVSTTTGFSCAVFSSTPGTSTLLDCHGELDPGQGAILTVTVTAASASPPPIQATATAFVAGDINAANNAGTPANVTVNNP